MWVIKEVTLCSPARSNLFHRPDRSEGIVEGVAVSNLPLLFTWRCFFIYAVPTALALRCFSAFWRYRCVVPNGTGGAAKAGRIRALKGRNITAKGASPSHRTKPPRRYFIYRTYGTRSATLPGFWRYRHAVPNGTANAAKPGYYQALKGRDTHATGDSPSHRSTITSNLPYRFHRYFLPQKPKPICK